MILTVSVCFSGLPVSYELSRESGQLSEREKYAMHWNCTAYPSTHACYMIQLQSCSRIRSGVILLSNRSALTHAIALRSLVLFSCPDCLRRFRYDFGSTLCTPERACCPFWHSELPASEPKACACFHVFSDRNPISSISIRSLPPKKNLILVWLLLTRPQNTRKRMTRSLPALSDLASLLAFLTTGTDLKRDLGKWHP